MDDEVSVNKGILPSIIFCPPNGFDISGVVGDRVPLIVLRLKDFLLSKRPKSPLLIAFLFSLSIGSTRLLSLNDAERFAGS